MKPKKVVLWGRRNVLGDGVEYFLAEQKDWVVVRIMEEETTRLFLERIELEQPNVVIVYESMCANLASFPYELLREHPEIKVITVCLENNILEVYDKHRVMVNQISDLYAAING